MAGKNTGKIKKAVKYHMITGEYPFPAKSVESMLMAHLKDTPQPPRVMKANISKYLSNLTMAKPADPVPVLPRFVVGSEGRGRQPPSAVVETR